MGSTVVGGLHRCVLAVYRPEQCCICFCIWLGHSIFDCMVEIVTGHKEIGT